MREMRFLECDDFILVVEINCREESEGNERFKKVRDAIESSKQKYKCKKANDYINVKS